MADQKEHDEALPLKLMVVLSKAYRSVMDQATRDIRNYGMSLSEFGMMEVLYTKGKTPLQQVGDKMLVTSGTLTYNADKLEGKGWIRRIPCREDRRVTYIELTEAGRERFAQIFPEHAQRIGRMMSGLTSEEQQAAIILLKKLGKGVQ